MSKNTGLSNAKTAKKDEFYTTYDIFRLSSTSTRTNLRTRQYSVTVMIRMRAIFAFSS